ncbi:MAG TPA: L,D-transpeptidase [Longimicrobiaceae bacterium]|nr:L,D-transpeptidase [Longimicrobiaceae bacterium]
MQSPRIALFVLAAALLLPGSPAPAQPALPAPPTPALRLVVNVPAGRLDLVRGDSVLKSYPVSVGTSKYPTPTGTFWISTVIWNPRWHPPESEWARNRKPEPPGPGNPMGRVKLHISELYYIHGTPSTARLGSPASHGCIRMANADIVDLTRRLHADRTPGFTGAPLNYLVANPKVTHPVPMHRPVRLDVVYRMVEIRDNELRLHPDVYRRGQRSVLQEARDQLRARNHPKEQVEHQALTDAYREWGRKGRARLPLATLAAPYVPPMPVVPDRPAAPRLLGVEVAMADSAVAAVAP